MAARQTFPDPESADEYGVVCVGAKPTPELLKEAYRSGIFPWPQPREPLLWFSPNPRFVLEPGRAHLHRSLQKALRKTELKITADTAFRDVIDACSKSKRPGQRGTWINAAMRDGYAQLHDEGYAHSIEAWDGDVLVGGLYGVSFGSVFFGESMFTKVDDASKIAFATLLANLVRWKFPLVDCQSYTDHLSRFGAEHWPRRRFLDVLAGLVAQPDRRGPWTLEIRPADVVDVLAAAAATRPPEVA
jgi:leucyl/phenylalanyl-tRNA--protein transferase